MAARTDIASESPYIKDGSKEGIKSNTQSYEKAAADITRVEIISEQAAQQIGKPKGRYLTVKAYNGGFDTTAECFNERALLLSKEISMLLPKDMSSGVLFAGLGNRQITPDCVGPLAADKILATRHIESGVLKALGELERVSVISPGVLAQTGLESAELIRLIAARISPSLIIVCDAFACSDMENLGCTVQLCDTGISPGSGVHNSRAEISQNTMGIPCIAIGIPTVADISAVSGIKDEVYKGMIITPSRIDTIVSHGAALISLAVNLAVHKQLTIEEINALVG